MKYNFNLNARLNCFYTCKISLFSPKHMGCCWWGMIIWVIVRTVIDKYGIHMYTLLVHIWFLFQFLAQVAMFLWGNFFAIFQVSILFLLKPSWFSKTYYISCNKNDHMWLLTWTFELWACPYFVYINFAKTTLLLDQTWKCAGNAEVKMIRRFFEK